MPNGRLPAYFHAPIAIVVLLISFSSRANSTAVAVLKTNQGFVILADSKQMSAGPGCGGDEIKKVFIVQGRFAIAAIGAGCVYGRRNNRGIPDVTYNIDNAWIHELQNSLPKNASLGELLKGTEAKFSSSLPTLQSAVTAGEFQPSDTMDGRFETFITFVIVGYEKGLPAVCILRFYIDWDARRFVEASPQAVELEPIENLKMAFYIFGLAQAVTDILNPKSYAYGQAMATCPKAFSDFVSHKPVSLYESIKIGTVLVQIEEHVNPNKVGGQIRGVEILPDGEATELPESILLPKAITGKPQKTAHK